MTVLHVTTVGPPGQSHFAVPDSYGTARVCSEDECITILCQFNPGPRCYCHERKRLSAIRRRSSEPEHSNGAW